MCPHRVNLNRGNHECSRLNAKYGFQAEATKVLIYIQSSSSFELSYSPYFSSLSPSLPFSLLLSFSPLKKYDFQWFEMVQEAFRYLPLCHVLNDSVCFFLLPFFLSFFPSPPLPLSSLLLISSAIPPPSFLLQRLWLFMVVFSLKKWTLID